MKKRATDSTIEIAIQISIAFAQLALFGLVPPAKDQTKNMMMLTSGMTETSMVIIHSPIETMGVEVFSGVSIMGFLRLIYTVNRSNIQNKTGKSEN